jgi:hypothetical protein
VQYFLATKTLVALRWLYFAQIKNKRVNSYAFDFMAHRGLANLFYATPRNAAVGL